MKTKGILALILAFAMIFTFAACGKKNGELSQEDIEKQREEELKNDPTANLKLSLEEWPVIDGATAMLPYYEEAAARILDMPVEEARQYVLCNTTDTAYNNLAHGTVDLIFCAPPSEEQVEFAKTMGVTYESKQILNSGFVFFVNKNNPVDGITSKELHDIYAGKITNWSQVGGEDEEIVAYQRSEGSGSQSGLYKHVIGQDEVMEAPTEKKIGSMAEIIDAVAEYDNSEKAIGYSYYYYITNMHYQEEVKLLAIDGIYPTNETISSGMYPFISQTSAFFNANEPADSVVRKIADWCAGAAGNILAEDLGYVPSKNSKTVIPAYTKVEPTKGTWDVLTQNNITISEVDCKQYYMGEYSTASYFQIEGLKDTKVQDKINARIKEVAESFLNDPYEPKYRGAALSDLTGIKCRGVWCNECFNANNIFSISMYASFSTDDFDANFSEMAGLNFDLKTGEEIKLADLFDKKTDGVGYINNALYESFNKQTTEYDYYDEILLAAPFTGIKADQKFYLSSYDGSLSLIFDGSTPEVYTYNYPTTYSVSLQGYFDFDKYVTKKSLFTDETVNQMFLYHDLGIGQYSDIYPTDGLIGDRNLWPWCQFMSYEGVDEKVNAIASGDQAKLDELTKIAVEAYDSYEAKGYEVSGDLYCSSDVSKVGPYYTASSYYSASVYYSKGDDSGYDASQINDSCCVLEGGNTPLEVKDFFKEGVDYKKVLKEAIYKALERYNEESRYYDYMDPIDMTNPKMDEFVGVVVEDIETLSVQQKWFSVSYKDDVATLATTILDDNENWANYQSALAYITYTEIGNENLNIFDDYR